MATFRAGAGEKERLAEERTEEAADRTVLANERTYTAWVRTGLAALVAGLAALRFMGETLPGWALKLVAVALMLYGLFCFAAAVWRYRHTGGVLAKADVRQIAAPALVLATALLAIAAVVALVGMWLA